MRSFGVGLGAVLCSGVLLVSGVAAQPVYPRGDADCSALLSAVDLVAAVRGAAGDSVCGNDDCDRDGALTPADVTCAVSCLFGSCAVPPDAPRIIGIAPDSAPSIVPLSVIRMTVDHLGSSERLKRVTVADAEAHIVGQPDSNTLLVVVPNIAPGQADVVVYDGDLAGLRTPIQVLPPVAIGMPDTFDGTLDLFHQVLLLLGTLDLEEAYGDDAAEVRSELTRFRGVLGIERAALIANPSFTPQLRAQLDATFERSGMPERLRQLIADITAVRAGGSAGDAGDGGAAQLDLLALLAAGSTAMAVLGSLISAGTAAALVPAVLASLLVNSAGFLALEAAGLSGPKISRISFLDADGTGTGSAVEGGAVDVYGERLFSTNLVMLTLRSRMVLEVEASGADSLRFRMPRGVYGECGGVLFSLRRTFPPFAQSNEVRSSIKPQLMQISGRDPGAPGEKLVLDVAGVAGCDPFAHFTGSAGGGSVPAEYVNTRQTRVTVPVLLPGDYQVSLRVGNEVTESLPYSIISLVTGLDVSCAPQDLVVAPGTPSTAPCVAKPLPLGVKVPPAFQTYRWTSSNTDIAAVRERAPVQGDGTATVTAVGPGRANIKVTMPQLNIMQEAEIRVRDGTGPSVSLSAPGTADPGSSISVSVTATDNFLVSRIVLRASGDAVSNAEQEFPCQQLEKTCSNSFTVGVKQTDFTQRQVTLIADAFDGVGNKGTSNAVTVTINEPMPMDTTPPQLTITSPPNGGTVNAGESIQAAVHVSDNQQGDTGVQRVVVDISGDAVVGGGAHSDVTLPTALPDATRLVPFTVKNAADLANVTNRSIVIMAQAFDAAGNMVSQSSTVSVVGTLDTCDGGIQADPPAGYIGDAVTISVVIAGPAAEQVTRVTSINPGGSFDLTKSGDVYTVTLFYQGTGAFTLSFTAFDAGGNSLCSGSIGLESLGSRPGSGSTAAILPAGASR